jgi:hypothetical protein
MDQMTILLGNHHETTAVAHRRRCYIRTSTARVQLERKILVVGLKGLDNKTS